MKKGQQGIEYMSTYGIAMVAAFLVIGGTLYFGIARPDSLVPAHCELGPSLGCADVAVINDTMVMSLTNKVDVPIVITKIRYKLEDDEGYDASCNYQGAPITVQPFENIVINTSERCLINTKGRRINAEPEIEFYLAGTDPNSTKITSGSILI